MGFFGFKRPRHITREIAITPPQPRPNRHGVAIMACVKNEERYIAEWLRFHKAIGVRHFFLYDDQSTDATLAVVAKTLPAEEFTIIPWSMRMRDPGSDQMLNGQAMAFAHAILNFGAEFERMAFIDVDEFLLPKTGTTLQEALAASNGFPNISLPWHMFGHGGHEAMPDQPVTMAYTKRVGDPTKRHVHASNFKCIVDPCEITQISVHHFETRSFGDRTSNDAGTVSDRRGRKEPGFYSAAHIQLNHYYSKSREEFQRKIDRGWSYDREAAKYCDKALATSKYLEDNAAEDRSMVDFLERTGIRLGQSLVE
jgi:hypothetical protein